MAFFPTPVPLAASIDSEHAALPLVPFHPLTPGTPEPQQNGVPKYLEYSGTLIHNDWPHAIDVPAYNRHDARADAWALCDTKGSTVEARFISILTPLDPLRMDILVEQFSAWWRDVHLTRYVMEHTSGYFAEAIRGLVLGPLEYDVHCLARSVNLRHFVPALIEIVLDRSPQDLGLLRSAYERRHGNLLALIPKNLRPIFEDAFACEAPDDWHPINQAEVQMDVVELHRALEDSKDYRMASVGSILLRRSYPHRVALCEGYSQQYRKPLSKAVRDKLSGTQKDAIMHILRDAELISDAMKGMGTKDELLVMRILRAHWNRPNMDAIRDAYLVKHGKTLVRRVKEDTSGAYRDLMVRLVEGSTSGHATY
ncbi:hypothetical protein C8J57DRAFT_1407334 [Mycena rebaudengoi]|nr:hypothetical protein C8J57DRAFT_1407334 [Mycena rebaudengoi]